MLRPFESGCDGGNAHARASGMDINISHPQETFADHHDRQPGRYYGKSQTNLLT